MNRFLSAFSAAFLGLIAVSCTGETVDYSKPEVTPPVTPSEVEVAEIPEEMPDVTPPTTASASLSSIPAETIKHFNDFSWKFYLANSAQSQDNVCVSPFSVGAVLGMIANGDDGAARNEILKMLGFEESEAGLNSLNTYYQTLLSNLPNMEKGITCDVTNTLWCDPNVYRIRKSFMEAISENYYAYGIGINPGGEDGRKAINGFVDKNTNGLIENFLPAPLDVDLAFLNTLYFKAGWSQGFDKYMTSKDIFLDIDGKEKEVDFMYCGDDWFEYAKTEDGTEAVRLHYGWMEQFSMTCILPSSLINHIPLDEVLTAENLHSLHNNFTREYVSLRLPKFEIETNNRETLDILKNMGLEEIAGGYCGFRLITESNAFFLKRFIHATKLKVDENGTEGAAVSIGGWEEGARPDENTIRRIVFDRPFIFYIQENTTGTILFIGSVKTFS